MSRLDTSTAALRLAGENLVPEEITGLLGHKPSTSYKMGDLVQGPKATEGVHKRKIGAWILEASDRSPGSLDTQIAELSQKLTKDLAVWSGLRDRFELDLYCGLFINDSSGGTTISDKTLQLLGERGIKLSIEVYCEATPSVDKGKGLQEGA